MIIHGRYLRRPSPKAHRCFFHPTFPWRKAVELQKHHWDRNGQCQLRAQGASKASWARAARALSQDGVACCAPKFDKNAGFTWGQREGRRKLVGV